MTLKYRKAESAAMFISPVKQLFIQRRGKQGAKITGRWVILKIDMKFASKNELLGQLTCEEVGVVCLCPNAAARKTSVRHMPASN